MFQVLLGYLFKVFVLLILLDIGTGRNIVKIRRLFGDKYLAFSYWFRYNQVKDSNLLRDVIDTSICDLIS